MGAPLPVAALLPLPSADALALIDGVGDCRGEALLEGDAVPEKEAAGEGDGLLLKVGAPLSVTKALSESDGAADGLAPPLFVATADALALPVIDAPGEASGEPEGAGDSELLLATEGEPGSGEAEGEDEATGALPVGAPLGAGDADALALPLPESLVDCVEVAPLLLEARAVAEGEPESVPAALPVLLAPPLLLPTALALGEDDAHECVALPVELPIPDALCVGDPASEPLPPLVPLPVCDAQPETLGDGDAVRGGVALPLTDGDALPRLETVPLPLPLGERLAAAERAAERLRDSAAEDDAPLLAERGAVGERLQQALIEAHPLMLGRCVRAAENEREAVAEKGAEEVPVPLRPDDPEAQLVGEPPAEGDAAGESECAADGERNCEGGALGDREVSGDGEGEGVPLARKEAEPLGVSRFEGGTDTETDALGEARREGDAPEEPVAARDEGDAHAVSGGVAEEEPPREALPPPPLRVGAKLPLPLPEAQPLAVAVAQAPTEGVRGAEAGAEGESFRDAVRPAVPVESPDAAALPLAVAETVLPGVPDPEVQSLARELAVGATEGVRSALREATALPVAPLESVAGGVDDKLALPEPDGCAGVNVGAAMVGVPAAVSVAMPVGAGESLGVADPVGDSDAPDDSVASAMALRLGGGEALALCSGDGEKGAVRDEEGLPVGEGGALAEGEGDAMPDSEERKVLVRERSGDALTEGEPDASRDAVAEGVTHSVCGGVVEPLSVPPPAEGVAASLIVPLKEPLAL